MEDSGGLRRVTGLTSSQTGGDMSLWPARVTPLQENWPEKWRLTFSSRSLLGSTSHNSPDTSPHCGSSLRRIPSMNHWTCTSWAGRPDTTSQKRVTLTFITQTVGLSVLLLGLVNHYLIDIIGANISPQLQLVIKLESWGGLALPPASGLGCFWYNIILFVSDFYKKVLSKYVGKVW